MIQVAVLLHAFIVKFLKKINSYLIPLYTAAFWESPFYKVPKYLWKSYKALKYLQKSYSMIFSLDSGLNVFRISVFTPLRGLCDRSILIQLFLQLNGDRWSYQGFFFFNLIAIKYIIIFVLLYQLLCIGLLLTLILIFEVLKRFKNG